MFCSMLIQVTLNRLQAFIKRLCAVSLNIQPGSAAKSMLEVTDKLLQSNSKTNGLFDPESQIKGKLSKIGSKDFFLSVWSMGILIHFFNELFGCNSVFLQRHIPTRIRRSRAQWLNFNMPLGTPRPSTSFLSRRSHTSKKNSERCKQNVTFMYDSTPLIVEFNIE